MHSQWRLSDQISRFEACAVIVDVTLTSQRHATFRKVTVITVHFVLVQRPSSWGVTFGNVIIYITKGQHVTLVTASALNNWKGIIKKKTVVETALPRVPQQYKQWGRSSIKSKYSSFCQWISVHLTVSQLRVRILQTTRSRCGLSRLWRPKWNDRLASPLPLHC